MMARDVPRVLDLSPYNHPSWRQGNYAVSGDLGACEKLMEIAKPEFKARMTVKLAVAGAFHTDFMAPAVPKLAEVAAQKRLRSSRHVFP